MSDVVEIHLITHTNNSDLVVVSGGTDYEEVEQQFEDVSDAHPSISYHLTTVKLPSSIFPSE